MTTRRSFISKSSIAAIAAAMGPRALSAMKNGALEEGWYAIPGSTSLDNVDVRQLAARALDAAKAAGAQYADVRFTVTRNQACLMETLYESEHIAFGVRALVDNAWGFVASPVWTADEAARLGGQAARQASFNNWGIGPAIEWGSLSSVASGSWSTPIKRDPITVSTEEKMDIVKSIYTYAARKKDASAACIIEFNRQERVFASTEGAFCNQTVYTALGGASRVIMRLENSLNGRSAERGLDLFTPRAGGLEVLEDAPLLDLIDEAYEQAVMMSSSQPADIGRYEMVFDAAASAALVGSTIGEALEIDRARGYEANAGGTSYLAPIKDVIGKTQISNSFLNVKADRTSVNGAASVRWDDDGIQTSEYDLVKNGVVADYASSREHLSETEAWYKSSGSDMTSRGCSGAADAMNVPVITMPNLSIVPGAENITFDDMIRDVKDGYAVRGGGSDMDHQKLTGEGSGAMVYRVKNGKPIHTVSGLGFLFRSPELWKNLKAVGGASDMILKGFSSSKGQPEQSYSYSVKGVPLKFSEMSVVPLRGARSV